MFAGKFICRRLLLFLLLLLLAGCAATGNGRPPAPPGNLTERPAPLPAPEAVAAPEVPAAACVESGPESGEPAVSATMPVSGGGAAGAILPPAATYYYSVYNWLRLQDDRESRRQALSSLEMAVRADPGSAFLRLEMAENLLKAGQLDAALSQAQSVLALEPDNLPARRLLAAASAMIGKSAEAIALYEAILQQEPNDSATVFYLVSLYVETLGYEKALALLQDFRVRAPEDPLVPFYQGKVYVELKLYQEAERYFKEVLELDPEMEEAWLNLGLIYEFSERRADAAVVYRRLLELDGEDRQVLERLGQLLVGEGKLDEALVFFQRLEAQGQASPGVNIKIALIYFQQGKYEEAAALLTRLHAEYPERSRVTFYLASSLEALERQAEALPLFLAIPEGDDLYYDARIHAAFLYEEEQKYEHCEKILRELMVAYPDRPGLYRMLSSLLRKQDDYQGALEVLQAGLGVNPEDYKLRFALGVVYNDLKKNEASIEVMQGLLREQPEDATVLNFIGYTYVELGVQLDDAEKLLRRAYELKPESGYIVDSLAWLFYVRGQPEKALEYLLKAKELVVDDPVIYDHLGDVYRALGRETEAVSSYRRSLEIKEAAKPREKLEKLLQKQK